MLKQPTNVGCATLHFRGCAKEVGSPCGKFIWLYDLLLLPAPNRYRKLQSVFKIDNEGNKREYYLEKKEYQPKAISMQLKEYPYLHNPIGLDFDLFETYIGWEHEKNFCFRF